MNTSPSVVTLLSPAAAEQKKTTRQNAELRRAVAWVVALIVATALLCLLT